MDKPLVGISTCLLGANVRYNGGHQLDRYLRDTLGRFVEFVPVCPEVECGMGVPREAVRLVELSGQIRLVTSGTAVDMTDMMTEWMLSRIKDLKKIPLCGFIFKNKSPSSGLHRVKVYREGRVTKDGIGVFARGFTEAFPLLPVEDNGRLHDDVLRENFIERIFVVHRWLNLVLSEPSVSELMDFHARHKYLIMAHSQSALKRLGKMVAETDRNTLIRTMSDYISTLMESLEKPATRKSNTNVLEHIAGYFKKDLSTDEKAELQEVIKDYHSDLLPIIVPVTLLNHYVRKYRPEYLQRQYFLNPHPMELMLRNHV